MGNNKSKKDARDEVELLCFLRGLRNSKEIRKAHQPTSLHEAVTIAKRYEAIENESPAPPPPRRSRSPGTLSLSTVSLALVLACILLLPSVQSNPYHHCMKGTHGVHVLPPTKVDCPPMTIPSTSITLPLLIHVSNFTSREVEAWQCVVEHYSLCTSRVVFSPTYNKTLLSRRSATEEECRAAVRERIHNRMPLVPVSNSIYSTQPVSVPFPDDQFFSTVCDDMIIMVAQRSTVGLFEDGSILSPLLNNSNICVKETKACIDSTTTVIWEKDFENNACNFITLEPVQAIIRNMTVVVEKMQSTLQLKSNSAYTGAGARCFKFPIFEASSSVFISFPNHSKINQIPSVSIFFQNDVSHNRSRRSIVSPWRLPSRYGNIKNWSLREIGRALLEFEISFDQVSWHYEEFQIEPRRALERTICAVALLKMIRLHYESFSYEGLEREVIVQMINVELLKDENGLMKETAGMHNKTELRKLYEDLAVMTQSDSSPFPERGLFNVVVAQFPELGATPRNQTNNSMQMDRLTLLYHFSLQTARVQQQSTSTRPARAAHSEPTNEVSLIDELRESMGPSHTSYLQATFDERENYRRNLSDASTNAKLNYLYFRTREVAEREFEKVYEMACKTQQNHLNLLNGFLRDNPTSGIRALLEQYDITAEFVGSDNPVLLVQQCISVQIARVNDVKKIDSTCYKYIPAYTEKNELYFIIPGTTEVTKSSPQEDCAFSLPVVKSSNSASFTTANGTIPVKVLEEERMHSEAFADLNVESAGLFRKAMGSSFPKELADSFASSLQSLRNDLNKALEKIRFQDHYDKNTNDMSDYRKKFVDFKDSATTAMIDAVLGGNMKWIIVGGVVGGIVLVIGIVVACCFCKYCTPAALILRVDADDSSNGYHSNNDAVHVPLRHFVPKPATIPSAPPLEHRVNLVSIQHNIRARINKIPVIALFDTGSQISILNRSIAEKAGILLKASNCTASSFTGNRVSIVGKGRATVAIGKYEIADHSFEIVEGFSSQLILGGDFISRCAKKGIFTTPRPDIGKLFFGSEKLPLQ